jgi:ubiquinone/menaquinone biosynthesis C-methylase UbiE/uncharacterized protein YbaR (Trm112 family)
MLDVGGGEGYLSALVRDLFTASSVHQSELSIEACRRAGEIFGIQGLVADASALPFEDDSYDLVVCSEVIEHLSTPAAAIAELMRVARHHVVISTAEFCPTGEIERWLRLRTLDREYPHSEVNWFTAADFRVLMGGSVRLCSQFRNIAHEVADCVSSPERTVDAIRFLTRTSTLDVDHTGVVIVYSKTGNTSDLSGGSDDDRDARIVASLLQATHSNDSLRAPQMTLKTLRCVSCRGALSAASQRLVCAVCGSKYEVTDGIPVMLSDVSADVVWTQRVEERIVTQLAGTDSSHARKVRRLVSRLHSGDLRHNGGATKKIAAELLRLWWLCCREEPALAKVARVVRRLRHHESAEVEHVRALFGVTTAPRGADS